MGNFFSTVYRIILLAVSVSALVVAAGSSGVERALQTTIGGQDTLNPLLPEVPGQVANAQDLQCSCSPTSYNFRLNLNGNCDTTTGFDNAAVDGSLCFFTQGGDPNDIDGEDIDFGGSGRQRRQLTSRRQWKKFVRFADSSEERRWKRILRDVDLSAHIRHAETIAQQHNRQQQQTQQKQQQRRAQGFDTTPTTITSISFYEADTTPQLNIINQDSTYFNITSASNGDVLEFPSISSKLDTSLQLMDQMDFVPGGVMLILFGVNADNAVVRNTVAWGYNTTNCDTEPLATGDSIGWVTLEEYAPPKAAFCRAVTDAPTASPSGGPTASPSGGPTASPSGGPTASPSDGPTVTEVITTTSTTTTTEAPMVVVATTTTPMVSKDKDTITSKSGKKAFTGAKSAKNAKTKASKALVSYLPTTAAVAKASKSKGDKRDKEHPTVFVSKSWHSKDTGEAVVESLEAASETITTVPPEEEAAATLFPTTTEEDAMTTTPMATIEFTTDATISSSSTTTTGEAAATLFPATTEEDAMTTTPMANIEFTNIEFTADATISGSSTTTTGAPAVSSGNDDTQQQPVERTAQNETYTQEVTQVLLGGGGGDMPLQQEQQQQQSRGKSSLKADDVMISSGGTRVYMSSSRLMVGGFCLLALSVVVHVVIMMA